MTVPASQENRFSYAGNGVTTAFAYSAKFLADADLVVVLVNDTTGVETVKTLTTHYTVAGEGTSAGTVTMLTAPASGETLVIYGDPTLSQLVDPVNGDALDVDAVIEAPLDKLTIIARRHADLLERAATLPEGYTGAASPKLPTPGALEHLRWNAAANALEGVVGDESTETFTQSGTGAVSRLITAKLTDVVSVKDFGAVGDGTTDDSAAIQAAITAVSAAGGGVVYFPEGVYKATGLTVSTAGVALVGTTTYGTRLRFTDTTGTLLTVTGALFRLEHFEIETPAATHTAGAIIDVQASQGKVANVRITGNFWNCFKLETDGKGGWFFDNVRVTGSNTLNSLIRVKGTAGTVADNHVINIFSATTTTWTEGAIILDTYVDTFRITGGTLGGTGAPLIWIKDSGTSQDPRYIHVANVYIENSASDANLVTIDAGDDIRFSNGYFGLGLDSVEINAGRDIAIKGNHFISCERSHIDYNGGTRVAIEGNTFLDASQATDVTHSTIDIAAGVTEWSIKDNKFRLRAGITNKPLRQLTIAAGASNKFFLGGNDWGVAGTDFGAAGAAAISDGSTGTNVVITDNVQTALYRGGAAVSVTGTTAETDLVSISLPAGALRTRDGVRFQLGGTTAGTNGTKTIKVYFGASVVSEITVPLADTDTWIIDADVFNANAVSGASAQTYHGHASRTAADTEGSVIRNKSGALSIDTTAAVTLKVTGTLANSGDTIVVRTCDIGVIRR